MSDNILRLIPTEPSYVPEAETQQAVRDLFESFVPQARKVCIRVTDNVEFIDQGSNWERVSCPICGKDLDETWWQQAMDTAYQTGFSNLTVLLPCCNQTISLNDLNYKWAAGFARFVLEAHNPNSDLDDHQLQLLEQALGQKLRKIWAHY